MPPRRLDAARKRVLPPRPAPPRPTPPAALPLRPRSYYKTILRLAEQYAPDAKSVIDVGAPWPYVTAFKWIPAKVMLNNRYPEGLAGTSRHGLSIVEADFYEYQPPQKFDLVLCNQVGASSSGVHTRANASSPPAALSRLLLLTASRRPPGAGDGARPRPGLVRAQAAGHRQRGDRVGALPVAQQRGLWPPAAHDRRRPAAQVVRRLHSRAWMHAAHPSFPLWLRRSALLCCAHCAALPSVICRVFAGLGAPTTESLA